MRPSPTHMQLVDLDLTYLDGSGSALCGAAVQQRCHPRPVVAAPAGARQAAEDMTRPISSVLCRG